MEQPIYTYLKKEYKARGAMRKNYSNKPGKEVDEDNKLNLAPHCVTEKAEKSIAQLSKIMPNFGGPRYQKK